MLVTLPKTALPKLGKTVKELVSQGYYGLYEYGEGYFLTTCKGSMWLLDSEGEVTANVAEHPKLSGDAYTFVHTHSVYSRAHTSDGVPR